MAGSQNVGEGWQKQGKMVGEMKKKGDRGRKIGNVYELSGLSNVVTYRTKFGN